MRAGAALGLTAFLLASGCSRPETVEDSINRLVTRNGLETMELALELYRREAGAYPESLHDILHSRNISDPSVIRDAWGRTYHYRKLKNGYVLFSAGSDGRPFTRDDLFPPRERPAATGRPREHAPAFLARSVSAPGAPALLARSVPGPGRRKTSAKNSCIFTIVTEEKKRFIAIQPPDSASCFRRDAVTENKDMLLLKIRSLVPSLNPALQKIGTYVLENPMEVKTLRIRELAHRCGVAEATVTRFVKTIGLAGFQEMKISLAEIVTVQSARPELVYDEVTRTDTLQSIVDKIFSLNTRALEDTRKIIDPDRMERAIDAIDRARSIDFYAAGGSFITAENARTRFYRIGKRCLVYNDPNQQAVSASLLGKDDVAIGISNSGRTASTVRALETARKSGATTICLTSFDRTPITRFADIVLFTSTQDSQFFQESMVSRIAQISVLDVLYAGLAVKTFGSSVDMIEQSARALKTAFL